MAIGSRTAYPEVSGGGGATPSLIGALGSLVRTDEPIPSRATFDVNSVSSVPYKVPVYQVQSQPTGLAPGELQRIYGTAAMPMFEFARRVQTGEVTIDPATFQAASDSFSGVTDEELMAQGVQPTTRQYIAEIAGGMTQAVISEAGQLASKPGAAPFLDQLGPAAKSYLPGYLTAPGAAFGSDPLTGYEVAQAGLAYNEVAVPMYRARDLIDNYNLEPSGSPTITLPSDHPIRGSGSTEYVPMYKADVDKAVVTSKISGESGGLYTGDHIESTADAPPSQGEPLFDFGDSFTGYAPGWGQTGMSFGVGFAANLAGGMKVKDAAKQAAIGTAGMYIGSMIGGPVGGMVGGMVANYVGGRVVCNELRRQGHMSKEMVLDDYRFTREFLSPQTVRGYHVWAIPVVRQMRKGRFIRLFKHLCVHRGNEIAYIYGKRDKPDYLGKVYRQLLEKLSWSIGLFCEASDWSILYKEKEV